MLATALPLLAANITHDPFAVACVVAAQHLPWIIVALGWASIASFDRRTMVGLVNTVRAVAVGYLGFLAVGGFDTIHKIEAIAFIVGLGEALTGTVEEEAGDESLGMRGMLGLAVVGMPLGGYLYEVFLAVPFLIDMLCFALAALFALFLGQPVRVVVTTAVERPQLASGTVAVTATALLASIASSAVLGVLVLFALENLGLGAPAFGVLLAGIAAATAAGAWVAPETGAALGLRTGFAVTSVMVAAALLTASKVADPARPWAGALALGIAWAAAATGTVLVRALLPIVAGGPVAGNALRAFHLVQWTGVCIGALAGGWIGRARSVGEVLAWAAAMWLVAAASVVGIRRTSVATLPREISSGKWLDAA